ncbi:hypothetical protein GGS23DRAFT_452411 [Durotheca rogersii]|uniref:uncharacterized protein n=1 Tax=Durotheca rogersii TaxID=419775 RepID=UPI00221F9452|nr:uncharacterized protein GGS23DRAFT_452411 [Durotheca rogersii]KAI5864545.1 hypothetical protein GGS23DRAFT_452411 [Durotheca rogersii]
MSVDIQDVAAGSVDRITRLLSRRPEYGIAIPSRRWLSRQEQKLESLPGELLMTLNPLKRLFLKIADRIDPNIMDPRAVLCKTHSALNPWLIRRLFLAVAYEVTVHSDVLRSWPGRKDVPALSTFVARVDAIAALWTEPELYHQCYGVPPFDSHMVFVRSECEACILSAVGANARALADIRSILVDRIERRPPRPDGRPSKPPRLLRFVETWIDHLKQDRAARCRAMSEDVLAEIKVVRPLLKQWRAQRREQNERRGLTYTELRRNGSQHRLSNVPGDSLRKRRTRNGIPVAMIDREDAEEQRRAAMDNHDDAATSIYRPDSMNAYSQVGRRQQAAYDPAAELAELEATANNDDWDPYDDFETEEGAGLQRGIEEEERGRSKVTEWYATRLTKSRADMTPDDTKSALSMVHPAFQPANDFSHLSAMPSPLNVRKDRAPTQPGPSNASVWTDVSVHSDGAGSVHLPRDAPPVPRVPSRYRDAESRPGAPADRTARTSRPMPQSIAASSVYSEQCAPSETVTRRSPLPSQRSYRPSPPTNSRNPSRNYIFHDASDSGSVVSAQQRNYLRSRQGMRTYSRENNPFTEDRAVSRTSSRSTNRRQATAARGSKGTATRVPSLSSSHGNTVASSVPSTPGCSQRVTAQAPAFREEEEWRRSWGVHAETDDDDDGVGPDDSLSNAAWRELGPSARERLENITPWASFAKLPPQG